MINRHAIERISSDAQSLILQALYRALYEYASGGYFEYRQISIIRIFLQAADILASDGVIKRPQNITRFAELKWVTGMPPDIHPDYGIDEVIAGYMRQSLWEMYLQGILAPSPARRSASNWMNFDALAKRDGGQFLDLDSVTLTPMGVDFLLSTRERIQVADLNGYMANFWSANPVADPELLRYLHEGVLVLKSNHLIASVVLLGAASEHLIDVLARALAKALGEPTGGKWYQNNYLAKRDISGRFESVKGALTSHYQNDLKNANLMDDLTTGAIALTFNIIRRFRNDVAHVHGVMPNWNEVMGLYHNFVIYFKRINEIIALLIKNPQLTTSSQAQ